jgi:hypothetical protein
MRVMEIFRLFAIVVVVMVGVGGVEMTHVALAQRHSGVDHFEVFIVFVFINAAARSRFGIARRARRSRFAA